ncbi:uncharacterized protein [Rutidosis leptorrhynchoides]|uniref:uncharacterized protein n=1 Tax=Rutidosis leptorrhynchoides TaxID=125765 RepID=UPI003A9920B4
MMLKRYKVYLCTSYSRGGVIKPYTLMYATQRDYSNSSLLTTGFFKPETHDDSNKPVLRGNNWYLPFLKDAFSEFRSLSDEKRRQWLAAHFILKKPETLIETSSPSSETDENEREIMNIVCSDKICIDAKPFRRESEVVLLNYEFDTDVIKVKSNSKIIKKVELFCAKRALIEDGNDDLLQQKLNDLNSEFRHENRIYALDLIIAALELQIKCLLDLMIEEFDDMFTKMTSDDEAYKILFVNLRGDYPRGKFEFMKHKLQIYTWAFDADSHKPGLRPKENINWDPELLKVSFYQYKTLPYDQRKQWLIAHFLLTQPFVASSIQDYRIPTEEEKCKLRLKFPGIRFFDEECKEEEEKEAKLERDMELEALAANRQKESLMDGHQIEEITEKDQACDAGVQFKKAKVIKLKKQLKELVME